MTDVMKTPIMVNIETKDNHFGMESNRHGKGSDGDRDSDRDRDRDRDTQRPRGTEMRDARFRAKTSTQPATSAWHDDKYDVASTRARKNTHAQPCMTKLKACICAATAPWRMGAENGHGRE